MKLRNFRQMARYDECDVILVENFDVLDFSPDVTTEEIKYLNERGVKIVSVDEGEITPDKLPDLYRKRFKVIVCNRSLHNRRRKIRYN
ncbi:MAG: recombinase family protein [Clostridia bacterium]|nr:recombinase family protein [Clostridia bacterium]